VAYAHTHIRHVLDPTLAGSIQHNWKRGHMNIKSEQIWLRFRRTWVSGFEELWKEGSRSNGIIPSTSLIGMYFNIYTRFETSITEHDRLVFRWLAIPWLQKEADSYVSSHNTSRRRADRRKILPNGIPDVMFKYPESVGARDFKVKLMF
jgi:hypothetical protein